MNKQELIKKLKELLTTPSEIEGYDFDFDDGYDFGVEHAISLAEQLDEPEKPVVTKYVSDWIEWCKKNNITFLGAGTAVCNNKNIRTLDASAWAMKNQETFAKAWFYGYEVEKEKLYTVEIPNPNHEECPILFKKGDGKVHIIFTSVPCWRTVKNAQLTESEIKKDFEWAFRWAKEVEE